MLWADLDIYSSPEAQHFIGCLDLTSGHQLLALCDEVWPHYHAVIKNRKHFILKTTVGILSKNDIQQLLVFAAGASPLGIEVASRFPRVKVFEIDAALVDKPTVISIKANLKDVSHTEKLLIERGWDRNAPTLYIFEGISYYLTSEENAALLKLSAYNTQSVVIFEYLTHESDYTHSQIPGNIFKIIYDYIGQPMSQITRYSSRAHATPMIDIEIDRTGQNTTFHEGSGWIEIEVSSPSQEMPATN